MKQQEEKMLTKYLSRFYKECLKSVGSLETAADYLDLLSQAALGIFSCEL